jgi:Electron transfer flavoprotein-ubiquinone oxidoreductase, 4Fe-4S
MCLGDNYFCRRPSTRRVPTFFLDRVGSFRLLFWKQVVGAVKNITWTVPEGGGGPNYPGM